MSEKERERERGGDGVVHVKERRNKSEQRKIDLAAIVDT